MKHLSGSRKAEHLSEPVSRQLSRYALAATAAGVGLLATVPAHAKIVYTSADITLPQRFYPLDLNHDGINDFSFYNYAQFHSTQGSAQLRIEPLANNEVMLNKLAYARALRAGVVIGPHRAFGAGQPLMAFWTVFESKSGFAGPWANGGKGVKNRYLGLKFHFKGGTHFGWARLNVSGHFGATLTGYAYETIPGKAIIAGATKGPDDAAPTASLNPRTPEPATLGMLAMGAPGLSIWRREESVATGDQRIHE